MAGYDLPSRRLVSQEDAAMIENASVPRSRFMGSWSRKTAFDAGYLVPFLVDEVLPGDHMTYDVTAYVRMATPLFPILDQQRIDTFFFYVPNRLLWDNWARFMGEQSTPNASIDYTIPVIESNTNGFALGSVFDHMGVPAEGLSPGQVITINALPLRAYNKVYNDWFRDQNLIAKLAEASGNGPDPVSYYTLARRAKSHDYFTSALPWPQKFTAPTVPLGGTAPILGLGVVDPYSPLSTSPNLYETGGASTFYTNYAAPNAAATAFIQTDDNGIPEVYADLSQATGVAINTLRQAFMVQSLLERDARGGTRYTEIIRSHFGVTSPDFRMMRPEYIGGGSTPLIITPIAQTAPTVGATVGALGAAGTAAGQHRASYAATEHGYILGLINVRTELSYQQGIPRLFNRRTRYDFYWPSLGGLGEQAILVKELYAKGIPADDEVFGYQERWHEYRTRYSEVTGIIRSDATGTLDAWHLAQRFNSQPTLSDTFIQDTPPMERVLAAGSNAVNQQYIADIQINRTAVRPVPMYGTPATLGRF